MGGSSQNDAPGQIGGDRNSIPYQAKNASGYNWRRNAAIKCDVSNKNNVADAKI